MHEAWWPLLEAQHRLVRRAVAVLGPSAARRTTLLRAFSTWQPERDEAELIAHERTDVSPSFGRPFGAGSDFHSRMLAPGSLQNLKDQTFDLVVSIIDASPARR
jgi:hypothetical protein